MNTRFIFRSVVISSTASSLSVSAIEPGTGQGPRKRGRPRTNPAAVKKPPKPKTISSIKDTMADIFLKPNADAPSDVTGGYFALISLVL